MGRVKTMGAVLAAMTAVGLSSCLAKKMDHTWYLKANGALRWVVLERDVRSDETDPDKRELEEREYWAGVRAGRHGVAEAFRELGGTNVSTLVLRDETPRSVHTSADYSGIEAVGARLLQVSHSIGHSTLTHDGELTTWELSVAESTEGGINPLMIEFLECFRDLEIVLVDGRFVSAAGFSLSKDGRVATLARDAISNEIALLRLTWRAGLAVHQEGPDGG